MRAGKEHLNEQYGPQMLEAFCGVAAETGL